MNTQLETNLIHAGEPKPGIMGAVNVPIFQSAMYEFSGESKDEFVRYIRYNNTPNHKAIEAKLAVLENGEDALVAASGMAAISTALLSVLSKGDHLLVQDRLYGGTLSLLNMQFERMGIQFGAFDSQLNDDWENNVQPNTRAILVESIGNPLMDVLDLKRLVAFAKSKQIITLIDNTFASPINFRPLEIGIDVSLHSCTKYINGHSDIVAGAIISNMELISAMRQTLINFGGTLDPHACYLLHRGMKTLAVRMRHQNESAGKLAAFLSTHPAVRIVNYPGLPSHPSFNVASKLFDGYSGMLSFELHGGETAAKAFMQHVNIPIIAPSLGGVESLVTRPALTSHSRLSAEARERLGITAGLVRVSVGLENSDDLIHDFENALGKM
ncbi:PLP-dependent transferase [candidate division KSB1 bacterium]|nr:PLP-dependent transferase [candidate division KSB1 bacterium]